MLVILFCSEKYPALYQLNNKYILSYSKWDADNLLRVYFIENNKFKKLCEIESYIFKEYLYIWNYTIYQQDYKFLFELRDGRIIILSHLKIIYSNSLNMIKSY